MLMGGEHVVVCVVCAMWRISSTPCRTRRGTPRGTPTPRTVDPPRRGPRSRHVRRTDPTRLPQMSPQVIRSQERAEASWALVCCWGRRCCVRGGGGGVVGVLGGGGAGGVRGEGCGVEGAFVAVEVGFAAEGDGAGAAFECGWFMRNQMTPQRLQALQLLHAPLLRARIQQQLLLRIPALVLIHTALLEAQAADPTHNADNRGGFQ
ncbi:uncharacterized protein EV422DRAFT_537952 [Fimicolochytrium jonesii]|uniref:uncharacterized protein n=1 Tax=Fimicolochytrium jonesii TaxID=1396493 RepID=UPI0022FEF179|nr:uncharacterized protein EV422DRAFT_537952 [Fimicolochytrium jonesii]KAI8818287.1 hypothetical protein EV422DRAFT_537952 [Fimicolochytrium jonesii]